MHYIHGTKKPLSGLRVHTLSTLLLVVAIFGLANIPRAGVSIVLKEPISTTTINLPCTNPLSCSVADQLSKTSDYLMRNKKGLTFTPDPRDIQPFSEYVRLTLDTQAGGFLNLYAITKKTTYLSEAEQRLNYIYSLGPKALNNSPFDGMTAYFFLQASELVPNSLYRYYGLKITDECLTFPLLTVDPGYMCDMALAKAYKITNDKKYLPILRSTTADIASRQYDNGGFPHWYQSAGPSANYTAWMIEEAYLIRASDPNNPDLDVPILNSRNFLKGLVNADGSVHVVPGEPDGVGMSTLSSIAYGLQGLGENATAQKVLQFLFSKQFTGLNSGAFADDWQNDNPNDYWTVTEPSVLRTSLIFWDLSNILVDQKTSQCVSGSTTSCVIVPTNCNSAFMDLNSCNAGYTGTNICLNGALTKCVNPGLVTYKNVACGAPTDYLCNSDTGCYDIFIPGGAIKCIGSQCASQCVGGGYRPTVFQSACGEPWPAGCYEQ